MTGSDRVARDEQLRGAVLRGDELAWQLWYDESFDALWKYALWRVGGDRTSAEEVVQETWLVAARRIREFAPRQASFGTWLRGVAAHVVNNRLRRQRIERQALQPLDHDPIDEQQNLVAEDRLAAEERSQRIALALSALPERYELVLRAKYLDGLAVEAIAAEWQATPKTIESLLSRAREAFRRLYRDPAEPCEATSENHYEPPPQ